MGTVSPSRLAIIGAIVALSVMGAIGAILLLNGGNATGATVVLGFLAPTIVSLLALIQGGSNAATSLAMHQDNQAGLLQLTSKVDGIGAVAEQAAHAGASAALASASAATAAQAAQTAAEGSSPGGADKPT